MLNLENLGVFLPQGYLFKQVGLQINAGERVALVGKNGAGKSTLLRIIAGRQAPSEGKVHVQKETQVSFLTQDIHVESTGSLYDFLFLSNPVLNTLRDRIEEINDALTSRTDYESESYLSLLDELSDVNHRFQLMDGYSWEEKIVQILSGLGFAKNEFAKSLDTFSGGWKMRAELARILVNQPDILLLDEPTNHLDILSISWLESFLKTYPGIVVLISHDRLFLDNVCNRTLDITQQKILDYPFSYSKYKEVRAEQLERMGQAKKQQDKDIKHTEELINKFRAKSSKAAFAQSLIRKLEKTERIDVESDGVPRVSIHFPLSVQPGKWVLELTDVGKTYGDKLIFKEVNITVGRGEKIALLGPNGVGKSTLLKRIMNKIDGHGEVKNGHNVQVTYFAQDQAEQLDKDKTVFETVDDLAVGEVRRNLRTMLAAFLFSGEDIDKKVGVLSGGERTRLALCQLLLSPSNVLILDEPTNHLDIQSKEVLKRALLNYEGTFLVVSHDREFLSGLTNRIWDLEEYRLKIHHFDVQEYLSYKEKAQLVKTKHENPATIPSPSEKKAVVSAVSGDAKKIERTLKDCEALISEVENKQRAMESQLSEGVLHTSDGDSLVEAYEQLSKQLQEEMSRWEELCTSLEAIKQQ
jgi:ATP-binding cassette subfamily F protein 3